MRSADQSRIMNVGTELRLHYAAQLHNLNPSGEGKCSLGSVIYLPLGRFENGRFLPKSSSFREMIVVNWRSRRALVGLRDHFGI